MSTIAFIPVRGGSKSIQNKNIRPLYGKPLVCWVIDALQLASGIDKIIVATDSDAIAETAKNSGSTKVQIYERSKDNASDSASTESAILEYLKEANCDAEDTFVLVQATSPFTTAKDFDSALDLYASAKYDSILSCARIKRFFWSEEGKPINYDYQSRPRRQDFEGTLIENGAFYINSIKNILEAKNRLSGSIGIYEMPEFTSLEIDEPADWEMAERILSQRAIIKNNKNIKLVLSDIDGVLTDAGMYYSEYGDELKKFNTYDGMGFQLIREAGIKVGVLTSENTQLNKQRAEKMKLDFVFQGAKNKLDIVKNLCSELKINLDNIAYIGDDINDLELLKAVGMAACPSNARSEIKAIPEIIQLSTAGGNGAFREYAEIILSK